MSRAIRGTRTWIAIRWKRAPASSGPSGFTRSGPPPPAASIAGRGSPRRRLGIATPATSTGVTRLSTIPSPSTTRPRASRAGGLATTSAPSTASGEPVEDRGAPKRGTTTTTKALRGRGKEKKKLRSLLVRRRRRRLGGLSPPCVRGAAASSPCRHRGSVRPGPGRPSPPTLKPTRTPRARRSRRWRPSPRRTPRSARSPARGR
mmetsp:Transcript_19955/g.64266  ORF Transcript_19955/g.64266 Transcript_19955/m.64266 type:complete len:204 (-) Transcript_19955:2055-2666(-)